MGQTVPKSLKKYKSFFGGKSDPRRLREFPFVVISCTMQVAGETFDQETVVGGERALEQFG